MRVDVLTKEYPPEIYGGAGVHVAELVAALRARIDVRVHAFGAPRDEPGTTSYAVPAELRDANPAIQTLGTDLEMVADVAGAAVVPGSSRGAPNARTRTSMRSRRAFTSSATWTPAPPYTSGGYSLEMMSTRMSRTLVQALCPA